MSDDMQPPYPRMSGLISLAASLNCFFIWEPPLFRQKPNSHRPFVAGPMHGRKQEPRKECEVIDKKSELGLIALPVRGPVKGEPEEEHINPGEQRRLGKKRPR